MNPARGSSRSWRWAGTALLLSALAAPLPAQYGESSSSDPANPPRRAPRATIFFPPFPPPLDASVGRNLATSGATAPAELADYAGEIFYPQLSSRLAGDALTPKLAQQLADYRAARAALLKELRETIAATRDAEPAARRQAFQALAARQAGRLAELEKTAEQLRADLVGVDRNWSEFREWHLSDRERRGFSPLEIAQVMRAYAHYERGLLPVQRQLLREIAVELATATDSLEKATATPQNTVFFWPATARVALPADLPPAVGAKVADFFKLKSALKKELYDAVSAHDGANSFFTRSLRSIAEKQTSQLAQLEALAEEIRNGLGAPPPPPAPPRSALPEAFATRFQKVLDDRIALQEGSAQKMQARILRARGQRVPAGVNYRFDDTGLKFVVVPFARGAGSPEGAAQIEALRNDLSAIADDYGRGLAELVNRYDEYRAEVAQLIGKTDPKAVDAAIASITRLVTQRTLEAGYAEYRVAVFQPGLSPEQRRLLFGGAIEALHLPLPRGEMQPQRRANAW